MSKYDLSAICGMSPDEIYSLLPESAKITCSYTPIGYFVRLETHRQLRNKDLIKPKICPLCGKSKYRMDIHHPDYLHPHKIIFCCHSCHMKIHCGSLVMIDKNLRNAMPNIMYKDGNKRTCDYDHLFSDNKSVTDD